MMRALTLTQPWCGLSAAGIKLVENRPRAMIKSEDFGKPFALHASREIDESVYGRIEQIWPRCRQYLGDNDATCPQLTCTRRDGHKGACDNVAGEVDDREWTRFSRVTSAVIAVATIKRAVVEWRDGRLVDAHGRNGEPKVDLGDQRRWFFGPIGYVLRDVRALAELVPCRGWQGFWTLPHDVETRVVEQLTRGGGR